MPHARTHMAHSRMPSRTCYLRTCTHGARSHMALARRTCKQAHDTYHTPARAFCTRTCHHTRVPHATRQMRACHMHVSRSTHTPHVQAHARTHATCTHAQTHATRHTPHVTYHKTHTHTHMLAARAHGIYARAYAHRCHMPHTHKCTNALIHKYTWRM
jgi:hypothetical protein